jgi:hypothetical protein
MKKLLLLTYLLFHIGNVYAQINHSTGTAQIGFPLLTLQEGKLSVPISINYDASGIKFF